MTSSVSNPHRTDTYSPLETLALDALREYGDYGASRIEGEILLAMISFANRTLEEVRRHQYWTGEQLDYYKSQTDKRPVPDPIMVSGLVYRYARHLGSARAGDFQGDFYRTMNSVLYDRKYGQAKIEMQVPDKETSLIEEGGAFARRSS